MSTGRVFPSPSRADRPVPHRPEHHLDYNVDMNVRVIFPVAARTRAEGGKIKGGRWYKWGDAVHDARRMGKYQGIPFRWAFPDPIEQDMYPPERASKSVTPIDKQPYISWLTRLANAAELDGRRTKVAQQMAGHGGVPLMVFQGEPFFGQDRFDLFFWRLRQSGLTTRAEPVPPFVAKPLRWPENL